MYDLYYSIVAPAYNEAPVIEKFVRKVMGTVKSPFELVIVDDGSVDETPDILARLQFEYNNLVVVRHPRNMGLGAGLSTGFKSARGDIVITMDADLSHDLSLVHNLAVEIHNGADVVIASRYVPGGGMKGVPLWRVLISRTANTITGFILRSKVKDMTGGFRAYKTNLVRDLKGLPDGFEVQFAILLQLKNKGVRFKEIPLLLKNREAGTSKMRYLKLIPMYLKLLLSSLSSDNIGTFVFHKKLPTSSKY